MLLGEFEVGGRFISVSLVDVTPELAQQWLDTASPNRTIKRNKLEHYVRDMRAGKWVFEGSPILFNGDGSMIDGQHRCHAIVRSGRTIKCLVIGNVQTSLVTDTGAARTVADWFRISGVAQYTDVAGAISTLWRYSQNNLHLNNISPSVSEAWDLYLEFPDIVDWVAPRLIGVPTSLVTMLRYIVIDRSEFDAFWDAVRHSDDLAEGNPALTLRRFARMVCAGNQQQTSQYAARVFAVITCWNSWLSGSKLLKVVTRSRTTGNIRRVHPLGVHPPEKYLLNREPE